MVFLKMLINLKSIKSKKIRLKVCYNIEYLMLIFGVYKIISVT